MLHKKIKRGLATIGRTARKRLKKLVLKKKRKVSGKSLLRKFKSKGVPIRSEISRVDKNAPSVSILSKGLQDRGGGIPTDFPAFGEVKRRTPIIRGRHHKFTGPINPKRKRKKGRLI